MSILLYSDNKINSIANRCMGQWNDMNFNLSDKTSLETLKSMSKVCKEYDNDKIINMVKTPRRMINYFGCTVDSHFMFELFGISERSNEYIYSVDILDRLDLVIASLTGASIDNIRNLENYSEVSKNLLSMNLSKVDLTLLDLAKLDENIAKYIEGLYSSGFTDDSELTKEFIKSILYNQQSILCYVGYLFQDTKSLALQVRSLGYGRIILTGTCKDLELSEIPFSIRNCIDEFKVNSVQIKRGCPDDNFFEKVGEINEING